MQYILLFAAALALVTCTLAAPRNRVDSDKRLNPRNENFPKHKGEELKNGSGNGTFLNMHNETHLSRLNTTGELNETGIHNRTHHEEHEHNVIGQPEVRKQPPRPEGKHEDSRKKHGKHSRPTASSTPAVVIVTIGANTSNNAGSTDISAGSNATTASNVPL